MKSLFKILLASVTLFILGQTFAPLKADAQYLTRLAKDSSVNATTRYLTFTSTPNLVTSISVTGVLSTGTLSLTSVTLESRNDTISGTSDWITVPASIAVVASTTALSSTGYVWHLPAHNTANGYRIKVVSSGTQKTYLYGSYLRRTQ